VVDSAPLLPLLVSPPLTPTIHVADIGSGAGFPGIVLALLAPSSFRFSLIESAGKKARFLQHVVNRLGLKDRCHIYPERVEKHSLTKNNEYHFVVSRAVGTLSLLAELSLDLLQPGGHCLALKGLKSESEIKAFLATPLQSSFTVPTIIKLADPPGATIIQLTKVPRGT
jgi:16S rRNA (guanine527-N7)-methyltransferase